MAKLTRKAVKELLGDAYSPKLDPMIRLLLDIEKMKPSTTSEQVRVGRLKVTVLKELGLSLDRGAPAGERALDDDDAAAEAQLASFLNGESDLV